MHKYYSQYPESRHLFESYLAQHLSLQEDGEVAGDRDQQERVSLLEEAAVSVLEEETRFEKDAAPAPAPAPMPPTRVVRQPDESGYGYDCEYDSDDSRNPEFPRFYDESYPLFVVSGHHQSEPIVFLGRSPQSCTDSLVPVSFVACSASVSNRLGCVSTVRHHEQENEGVEGAVFVAGGLPKGLHSFYVSGNGPRQICLPGRNSLAVDSPACHVGSSESPYVYVTDCCVVGSDRAATVSVDCRTKLWKLEENEDVPSSPAPTVSFVQDWRYGTWQFCVAYDAVSNTLRHSTGGHGEYLVVGIDLSTGKYLGGDWEISLQSARCLIPPVVAGSHLWCSAGGLSMYWWDSRSPSRTKTLRDARSPYNYNTNVVMVNEIEYGHGTITCGTAVGEADEHLFVFGTDKSTIVVADTRMLARNSVGSPWKRRESVSPVCCFTLPDSDSEAAVGLGPANMYVGLSRIVPIPAVRNLHPTEHDLSFISVSSRGFVNEWTLEGKRLSLGLDLDLSLVGGLDLIRRGSRNDPTIESGVWEFLTKWELNVGIVRLCVLGGGGASSVFVICAWRSFFARPVDDFLRKKT